MSAMVRISRPRTPFASTHPAEPETCPAFALPQVSRAGTLVDILTPVNVTISTRNFNDASIVCGVPIGLCNASSPFPLINVSIQPGTLPPFFAVDVIHNVQNVFASGGSGYITFIGLDASALDHVIIGLRNGFVNAGDPWPFSTSESTIAADLLSGDAVATADLRSFFLSNLTAFPQILGAGGTLYRFSGASIVATIVSP